MSALPSAIAFSAFPGDEVHYRLPQRPLGPIRYLGLLPMAFGLFIASLPILGIVFFLTARPALKGKMLQFAVIGPLVAFGPICFPLGGFILFKGLLAVAGHTEIAVRAGRLYLTDRCGLLRWTRRRPLDKLRGFRVEHGHATRPDGPRAMDQLRVLTPEEGDADTASWPRLRNRGIRFFPISPLPPITTIFMLNLLACRAASGPLFDFRHRPAGQLVRVQGHVHGPGPRPRCATTPLG